MTLSPGRSRGADAGCFCGLNTQHDPWRASAFAWRPCGHQKTLQRQRPIEADTIDRCKAWLAALPPACALGLVLVAGILPMIAPEDMSWVLSHIE